MVTKLLHTRYRVTDLDKTIKSLDTTTLAVLEFRFELEQYLGTCEIADVQVKLDGK